jgi:Cys-rich repeat protein
VPQCTSNGQCASGQECVNGTCKSPCWADNDCGLCSGEPVCVMGYCAN